MKNAIWKKGLVIVAIAVFFSPAIMPAIGTINSPVSVERKALTLRNYSLPPPMSVDMILEESIFRRASVREFTDEPITDEELSTILWAACGYREDGKRTVPGIDGVHAAVIYVLKEDAAYKYDALNHSLIFYKEGDWRDIVGWQYEAPIQLGLCWNTDKANPNYGGAELGEIGQNIAFMANALELGTVVCGQVPPAIEPLGIPDNEEGMIVMPLGHPEYPYEFTYMPMWLSFLPRIQYSNMSLATAIQKRNETTSWEGKLTRREQSQVIWASYGYSYYLDERDAPKNPIKRHRTVPSAHGYYPLRMYAVTKSGIYRYIPGLYKYDKWGLPIVTFMLKIRCGDNREEIAQASSQSSIASAPLSIISVLDIEKTYDLSGEQFRRFWYYEAGASVHNVLLEATAWNLSANIVFPIDITAIRSLLRLNNNFIPLLIVPVGR